MTAQSQRRWQRPGWTRASSRIRGAARGVARRPLEGLAIPNLLVFTQSDDAVVEIGSMCQAIGWSPQRGDADPQRADADPQRAAQMFVQNADAVLFDLEHPVPEVERLMQAVGESSPFLPVVFLSSETFTLQDLGNGLRYQIDPAHMIDLEHILISLSFGFPSDEAIGEAVDVQNPVPRVLIVDDNPQFAGLLERTLRSMEQFDVRVAKSGFEAASILPAFRPDVAIVDLALGDMDGREVCTFIRNHERLRNVKVIGVSGYLPAGNVAAEATHFDAFLEKPFRVRELVEKVMGFLSREG